MSKRSKAIEEFTLPELKQKIQETHGKKQIEYQVEYHARLLWPLTPIVFMLIACAGLLQPIIRRHGAGRSVFYVSATAIAYQLILILAQSITINSFPAALYLQWALPIALSLVALITLHKSTHRN